MSQLHVALLGRDRELSEIDEVLDHACAGDSRALALVGAAGNGKTTLLSEATRRGIEESGRGMTVLRARGIESEAEVAFAGLLELVRPLAELIARLPEPQARALEGALALVPAEATDRFSVSAATLAILGHAAAEGPVLVVVDDLHWLDPPSAQAILFAARRLWREGIAILLGSRPEGLEAGQLEGIEILPVGPLPAEDAATLARAAASRDLGDAEVEALVSGTGGNPLAIVEAARAGRVAPAEGVVIPIPVADRIQVGVEQRLERLGDDERRAVLIAAAAGTRAPARVLAHAFETEDLRLDVLDAAEREGLLGLRGEVVEFEHPLTRSAAYAAAESRDQRRAHRALANTFPEGSAERAWHLAAAARGPDEEAASALEAAGREAMGRGAPSTAARAFARAGDLSMDVEDEARRLLLSGGAARLAGSVGQARDAVTRARDRSRNPLVRADALEILFQIDAWRAPMETARSIVAEADQLAELDRHRAARILAEAAAAMGRSGFDDAVDLAARAKEETSALGVVDDSVELSLLFTGIISGRNPEAVDGLRPLGDRLLDLPPSAQTLALLQQVAWLDTWVERYDDAAALLDHLVSVGRARAPGSLPMSLAMRGELGARRGKWQSALADTTEAAELAADFGELHPRGLALTCRARVEAALGSESDCRATAAEAAQIGRALGGEDSPVSAYGAPALGLLELGLAHPERAIPPLEHLMRTFRAGGIREPGVVLAAGDLVEAYVLCDRRADAEELLSEFESLAETTGRTGARAIALRCRGILAPDVTAEGVFRRALEQHDRVDMPLEHARTLLALGHRLASTGRHDEARSILRDAQGRFSRLGARLWERRALDALEQLGEVHDQADASATDPLTPQELQVAVVAASGASNPETGAQLFLSAKTVQAHLERIYAKLGIRSRAELAQRVSAEADGASLTISSLGAFSVASGGRALDEAEIGGPDARLALAVLLAARGPVPADVLAGWMRPGAAPNEATPALARAIAALRDRLGRDRVAEDGDTLSIQLQPGDSWDALRLIELGRQPGSELLSPDATEEALAAFSGVLFPEWPEAAWAVRLQADCVDALSRLRGHLAESLLERGDHGTALAHFSALCDADPAEQAWHRGVMRCHAAAGDLPLALRQYHECRSALRLVRGEDPDANTKALYMELLSAR